MQIFRFKAVGILSILEATCVATGLSRAQNLVLFGEEEGTHRGENEKG